MRRCAWCELGVSLTHSLSHTNTHTHTAHPVIQCYIGVFVDVHLRHDNGPVARRDERLKTRPQQLTRPAPPGGAKTDMSTHSILTYTVLTQQLTRAAPPARQGSTYSLASSIYLCQHSMTTIHCDQHHMRVPRETSQFSLNSTD